MSINKIEAVRPLSLSAEESGFQLYFRVNNVQQY